MPGVTPPDTAPCSSSSRSFTSQRVDELRGGQRSSEFKVRVVANAVKICHNWDLSRFCGRLNSNIAVPTIYEKLHVSPGDYSKTGIEERDSRIVPGRLPEESLHWYYEGDVYLPGAPYTKGDVVIPDSTDYAAGAGARLHSSAARRRVGVSSKYQYIVNFNDTVTNYRSGNEFTWEVRGHERACRARGHRRDGYLYQQTTNDELNGAIPAAATAAAISPSAPRCGLI